MRDRPIPKLVRLDPGGAYVSNAMFEVITGLNLDVQVTPLEALWHLSVLDIVQQLVHRSVSLDAMGEGRTSTRAECLSTACTAYNRSLERGWFAPFRFLFGHELEPPEGESLHPEREGLDLTSFMAEHSVRQMGCQQRGLRRKQNTERPEPRT